MFSRIKREKHKNRKSVRLISFTTNLHMTIPMIKMKNHISWISNFNWI